MGGSRTAEKSFARRRLPPEESRKAALEAARDILINQGPQAVTLKSVASAVGRTHANLLHHFGSAYELQQALCRYICDRIISLIERSVDEFNLRRDVELTAEHITSFTYAAFEQEGGGPLAAWMITNGQGDSFRPVLEAIGKVMDDLESQGIASPDMRPRAAELIVLAFGYSILGPQLSDILGLDKNCMRRTSSQLLAYSLKHLDKPVGETNHVGK